MSAAPSTKSFNIAGAEIRKTSPQGKRRSNASLFDERRAGWMVKRLARAGEQKISAEQGAFRPANPQTSAMRADALQFASKSNI
jgi:hypothetical protein